MTQRRATPRLETLEDRLCLSQTVSVSDSSKVNTAVAAPNLKPEVTVPSEPLQAEEGKQLVYKVQAKDPEGKALTFSIAPVKDGPTIDATKGEFKWTPNEQQGQKPADKPYEFKILVKDAGGAKTEATLKVAVKEDNKPHTINAIGKQEVQKGYTLSLLVGVSDVDDPKNQFTYKLIAGDIPDSAINHDTGLITWVANVAPKGFTAKVQVTDKAQPANVAVKTFDVNVFAEPRVEKVLVNNDAVSNQRSMVGSLAIYFSGNVSLDPGAIEVRDSSGKLITTTLLPLTLQAGKTVATVQFASLADGAYTLTVFASKVKDTTSKVAMLANSTTKFHRLFGDSDGDADIDASDLFRFNQAQGKTSTQTGYLSYFDFNKNNKIDTTDAAEIQKRFGGHIG